MFIKEHLWELLVPLSFTALWVVSLYLAAFDVIEFPTVQSHKIAVALGIALILFFLEYSIISFDSFTQYKHKNFSSKLHIPGFAIGLAFAGFLILAFLFLNGNTSGLVVFLAIICVAVPKFISCDLSRNPHHYWKKRSTSQKKEKDNISSEAERAEKTSSQNFTNEAQIDQADNKPINDSEEKNKSLQDISETPLNNRTSDESHNSSIENKNIDIKQ